MSCCVTSLHLRSKSHLVSFFALMWLEAEWSSTSKCVGPSIIPLCKYLHKETSRLALARSRESPVPGTHSSTEPYTAMTRDRERDRANSRKGAGGKWIEEKDKREENEKVLRFWPRDRNQKKRRHMDTEARWYKRFRAECGRWKLQSGPSAPHEVVWAGQATHFDTDVTYWNGASNILHSSALRSSLYTRQGECLILLFIGITSLIISVFDHQSWLRFLCPVRMGSEWHLCVKECQHGGTGMWRCYMWELLLQEGSKPVKKR